MVSSSSGSASMFASLRKSYAASKPSRRLLMIASASAMIRAINSLQVGMCG
jgi:hypothetical protein